MKPIFTICIPTYNRANTIKYALKSLDRQSLKKFEIIVVDDGSTDNTEKLIKAFKNKSKMTIYYYFKENGGKHTALNLGIEKATGQYFLILDSDDQLTDDALESMYKLLINNNIAGVMGKSADQDGMLIGLRFPKEHMISSYIDFHFGSGFSRKGNIYGDCCECVKTEEIKKFRFPEDPNTKFVPESYIYDKIGISEYFICTNDIFKIVEYHADGITKNAQSHQKKNIVGFLYKYVDNLDYIMPQINMKFLPKFFCWYNYWNAVDLDPDRLGPRVKNVSFFGFLVRISIPLFKLRRKILTEK